MNDWIQAKKTNVENEQSYYPLITYSNDKKCQVMPGKPTIVHVIDNLNRGGAETLLIDLLKDITSHYNIVLVTLDDKSDFEEIEVICQYRYSLNCKSKLGFPSAIRKLKKIIDKHQPVLVRSQLYWSTIIARIACPAKVPLIFSVHITLSDESFRFNYKGVVIKWLEKITYKKKHTMLGVTKAVVDDYDKSIVLKGDHYVLHNYVNKAYFDHTIDYVFDTSDKLELVAVGNPRKQKNYELLLHAMRELNDPSVTCDIYGSSSYDALLQREIGKYKLPVYIKGKSSVIYKKLQKYDAFIMSSLFEGFGIAVAEAMTIGLPLLLADLSVLREVSCGNAIFFDPNDEKDLARKILDFRGGKYDVTAMSKEGKKISRLLYTKDVYMTKLLHIYDKCITV